MMKLLIAVLVTTTFLSCIYASGCGGPQGAGIYDISVISTQEIQDYQIIAWAPGVVQIKLSKKLLSLVNLKGKGLRRNPGRKGKLTLEKVSFYEYDGCDRYDLRITNRYKLEIRNHRINAIFSWPVLQGFQEYDLPYHYSTQALQYLRG